MPPPLKSSTTGGRLSGEDLSNYFQDFAKRFLEDRIRFGVEVLRIKRGESGHSWMVLLEDISVGARETLEFDKLVLCTGVSPFLSSNSPKKLMETNQGCSQPYFPANLSPTESVKFKGPVIHSSTLRQQMDNILSHVKPLTDPEPGLIVVVGGGRSAQEYVAARLWLPPSY